LFSRVSPSERGTCTALAYCCLVGMRGGKRSASAGAFWNSIPLEFDPQADVFTRMVVSGAVSYRLRAYKLSAFFTWCRERLSWHALGGARRRSGSWRRPSVL
jgi:hypothetical protein